MNVRGLELVWLLFLKTVYENCFWKHIEHQKVLFESFSLLFEFSVFYVSQKKKKPKLYVFYVFYAFSLCKTLKRVTDTLP